MRFSLRNMLWTTFWLALWSATFPTGQWMEHRGLGTSMWLLALVAVFVAAPCAAVGSLLGKTKAGILVGALFALGACLFFYPILRAVDA